MIRERFAGRPLARGGRHLRGFGRRHFGGELVLGRCGLQFLQRQLELIQKPRGALRARAITVAVQLLDLQLQVGDQRLVIGLLSTRRSGLRTSDNQGRFQRFDVRWEGVNPSFYESYGITKSAICGDFFSAPQNFFKPSPRSAVAKYVADFSSRSPPTDNSSVPRSAPPRHPPSPATRSVHGRAAWHKAIVRSRHATGL